MEPDATCESTQFQCDGGECIEARLRCDGNYDCPDATDEFDCGNYSRFDLILEFLTKLKLCLRWIHC